MRFKSPNRYLIVFSLFYLILIANFHQAFSQEETEDESVSRSASCRSIFRRPASCVSLLKCEPFVKVYKENPHLGRRLIIRSICSRSDTDIIVCCPDLEGSLATDYGGSSSSSSSSSSAVEESSETTYKPLYPPKCGHSDAVHDRVVGGRPSAIGAWPWIAAIGYGRNTNRISFRCGGSLISSRHVVTAAHCVSKDLILVRLREHNLLKDDDGAHPRDILVEKSTVHPDYDEDTLENDIAVLRLNKDVAFTDAIHPICLPLEYDIKNLNLDRYYPFIAGWGSKVYQGTGTSVLNEAQVPVIKNEQCVQDYRRIRNTYIDDRVLCAGYRQGGKDACQGDSGGPLMLPQKSTYYLIGVVSGGYKCAEAGFPGIYTRVTSFLDFIQSNMK